MPKDTRRAGFRAHIGCLEDQSTNLQFLVSDSHCYQLRYLIFL